MKKNKEKMPSEVWLKEECDSVPEGSCIEVKSQTATTYTGIWASQLGSFTITVEKEKCTKTSNLKELLKAVSQYNKKQK